MQKRLDDERLFLYGQVNFEQFNSLLSNRVTFDAGGRWDLCDFFKLRGNVFLENVEENGESLRQDIYRGGGLLGADLKPTRLTDVEAYYRWAAYSDDNFMNEWYAQGDYYITLPPRQLRFVLDADYLMYRQQSTFPNGVPVDQNGTANPPLFGVHHPYFSPLGYAYYEARLEWTQWLSRDFFIYSDNLSYTVQYAVGWDSNLVNYQALCLGMNYDVKSWLSVGAQGQVDLSTVYNQAEAFAYVRLRWPDLH